MRALAEILIQPIQLDQNAVSRKQYVKLLIELVESQRLVDESEQQLTESSVKLILIKAIWPVVSQSTTKHDFDLLTRSVVYLQRCYIDQMTDKMLRQGLENNSVQDEN